MRKRLLVNLTGLFVVAMLSIFSVNPTEAEASTNSNYDKIISYVKTNGKKTESGSGIWTTELAENIRLSYDSTNQSIKVEKVINYGEGGFTNMNITVFVNSPIGEVQLKYSDDVWGYNHLSSANVTEHLYKGSDGKKYKYLAEWECWNQNMLDYQESYIVNDRELQALESSWLDFMNNCSAVIEKKVGVTFKPFTKLSGYSAIAQAYHEAVNTEVSVKLPFEISYNTLTALEVGDSITYKASYDFDGDKKKDKLTVKLTAKSKEDYSYQYDLLIKINNKKCVSKTIDFGFEIEWKISAFDLNPGDKYKELMSSYYENVPTDFVVSSLAIYRYNGSKIKCMHDIQLQQDSVAKQKKNDNLQLNAGVWISGVGYSRILTSIKSGTTKIVGPKNRIYNCLDSETEYQFAQSITLYKTADCKEKSGTIQIGDSGTIQKVKLEKDTLGVTHFYVCLTNGKKGWVNLEETRGYLVYGMEMWDF